MGDYPERTRRLTSTMTHEGRLELEIVEEAVAAPADDQIVLRVEAAPVNPTDLGLMLGAADVASATREGERTVLTVPPAALPNFAGRLDLRLNVGSEGAGTVVAAGSGASALLGRTVCVADAAMYAGYRTVAADSCLVLPDGVPAAQGAAAFINPMTALGMVETMRLEGHRAIVHTAAASNLGRMLARLCREEGIELVNVVRRPEQVAMLRDEGATHICNSSEDDFDEQLRAALDATGATIAFDATGGPMPGRILRVMEQVAVRRMTKYSHYGSPVLKQVYVYGGLDPSPITIDRAIGMAWRVDGWLLFHFLDRVGRDVADRLRDRAAEEITTTFASHFDATISLEDAIKPETMRAYAARATGRKYLIDPQRR